jgi:hypothetical protein
MPNSDGETFSLDPHKEESESSREEEEEQDDLIPPHEHNLAHATWFQEEMMDKEGYTEKETKRRTGIILNRNGKHLLDSNFTSDVSYKAARVEMQRSDGIFQIRPRQQLLNFMTNFDPTLNPEFIGLLDETSVGFMKVRQDVILAFSRNIISQKELEWKFDDIFSTASILAMRAGGSFSLSLSSEIAFLSLGIVARPSENDPELMDIHSGYLGRCDEVYSHQNKAFAIVEYKNVLSDQALPWHRQGTNLCLQLYNSFIGAEAEVGIALVLGGIHVVWREKAPNEGKDERFIFYRLSRQFSEIRNEEDLIFFTKFFIHLARICSTFEKSAEPVFCSPSKSIKNLTLPNSGKKPSPKSSDLTRFPSSPQLKSPDHKKRRDNNRDAETQLTSEFSDSEETFDPTISWISVANPSGDDIVFGVIKLSECFSEKELEKIFDEERNEQDEDERFFSNQLIT